jgi:hypothetical protein
MNPFIRRLALALLVVSIAVALASPIGVAVPGRSTANRLAGPWYTPQELKALIAYSNASFTEKQALLAGAEPSSIAARDSFHWGDAGIGAGVALACVLLAGAGLGLLVRYRPVV